MLHYGGITNELTFLRCAAGAGRPWRATRSRTSSPAETRGCPCPPRAFLKTRGKKRRTTSATALRSQAHKRRTRTRAQKYNVHPSAVLRARTCARNGYLAATRQHDHPVPPPTRPPRAQNKDTLTEHDHAQEPPLLPRRGRRLRAQREWEPLLRHRRPTNAPPRGREQAKRCTGAEEEARESDGRHRRACGECGTGGAGGFRLQSEGGRQNTRLADAARRERKLAFPLTLARPNAGRRREGRERRERRRVERGRNRLLLNSGAPKGNGRGLHGTDHASQTIRLLPQRSHVLICQATLGRHSRPTQSFSGSFAWSRTQTGRTPPPHYLVGCDPSGYETTFAKVASKSCWGDDERFPFRLHLNVSALTMFALAMYV